ncbi:hypothetical protein HNP33_003085 [Comamonas odontotermitis]|uniref:Uncharacterized protein n=1 Tax=Comamonas odontotermitis TaxID=379895 RepID=A0ABR6RIH9_9BURK|nr:DUF5406 family protein [Comamonas odontotermitis]MBB6578980.1 hypothetical protein [Comamonas odontotermitis]
MIENYDPNIRWGRHTYRVTLQKWNYVGAIDCEMGGNMRGFKVIEAAVSSLADDLHEARGENPTVTLVDPTGEEKLHCQPDGENIEDWLYAMVVGVELIKHEAEDAKW